MGQTRISRAADPYPHPTPNIPFEPVTNPIDTLFARLRTAKQKAFMPFIPAGDPDLDFTRRLLATLAANGADLIEVGVPFSVPIADGPVIQASYTRALRNKMKIADMFECVRAAKITTPMVAMAS